MNDPQPGTILRMSTCRLCGRSRKLIKAHAIPEAFFRAARGGEPESPLLVSAGDFPRRATIGIYGQGILCSESLLRLRGVGIRVRRSTS